MTRIAGTGFEDVDRTPNPSARVSYLDAVAAVNEVMAYKRHTFELIGVDSSETMLAEARARTAGLPVQCRIGDAHQLEFPSDMFASVRADRVSNTWSIRGRRSQS